MDDSKESAIRECNSEDEERFEEAYDPLVEDSIQQAVSWENLIISETILPDLAEEAKNIIQTFMGYMPLRKITIRYEPYLRALIQQFNQGILDEETFLSEVKEHLKLIRNEDLEEHSCLSYPEEVTKDYYNNFSYFSYLVKKRYQAMLGYEPNAKHAMVGEIWYRNAILHGEREASSPVGELDYKIIAIIKYREVLLEKGKEAADQSPVWDRRMIGESLAD